ncbi:hypothetical protein HDU87_007288 [Geranomyces variabilis]|uniref:Ubiquitin-like domain-containing protein n=1 Tax=Geranomyces variabilis TaxID=109894 RepID=A0AAD5TGF1_9FUNG|nr:hypothetical protein HDU87_007288 [Geranomyces variabilis]
MTAATAAQPRAAAAAAAPPAAAPPPAAALPKSPPHRKRPYASRRRRRPQYPPSDEEVGGFISSSTDDEKPTPPPPPASSGSSANDTQQQQQPHQRRPQHKRARIAPPRANPAAGGGGGVMDDDAFRSFFESSSAGARGPSVFSRARAPAAAAGSGGSGSSGVGSGPPPATAGASASSSPPAQDETTTSATDGPLLSGAAPSVSQVNQSSEHISAAVKRENGDSFWKRRAGELSDLSDLSDDDDEAGGGLETEEDEASQERKVGEQRRGRRAGPLTRGHSSSSLASQSSKDAANASAAAAQTAKRELSLTPPPDLTARDLALVHSVRQTLDDMGRQYRPKAHESPFEREAPLPLSQQDQSLHHQPRPPPRDILLPLPTEAVLVTVEYSRYPALPGPPPRITFRINMDQPFDRLMIAACATYSMDRERSIFVCRGTPVFPRATPNAVRMHGDAVLYLYHRVEYDMMKAALMQPAPPPPPPPLSMPDLPQTNANRAAATTTTTGDDEPPTRTQSPSPPPPDTSSHVLVKLAHQKQPQLKLKVPVSRTMADLVAAFVAHQQERAVVGDGGAAAAVVPLAPGMVYRIVFEGETVPSGDSLEDAGVENGDVLEVHARPAGGGG